MSEKTPFDLEKARTPENNAIHAESKLSENEAIEKLLPGARSLVEAHRNSVVYKVEKLLGEYKNYKSFPEGAAQKLADEFGTGEVEMIKAITIVLTGEDT